MTLELSSFVFVFLSLRLPGLYLSSKLVNILFKFGSNLFAFSNLNFVIAIVIDLRMQLKFLVLERLDIIVLRSQQIV